MRLWLTENKSQAMETTPPAPISHLKSSMLLSVLHSRSFATYFAGSQYPTLGSCSPACANHGTVLSKLLKNFLSPPCYVSTYSQRLCNPVEGFRSTVDWEIWCKPHLLSPGY